MTGKVGRKLIKGSLLRNLEFFILVAVTFIMSPMVIHSLGDRMYGFWILIGSFVGYYGLLDFGLSSAVGRFVSRGLGQNDLEDVSRVVSTSLGILLGIAAVSILITLSAVAFCGYFIQSAEEIALFRHVILLMGISLAMGFPAGVFGGILTSHLRYDVITCISIIRCLVTNGLIYYFLLQGHGIMMLTIVNVAGSLFQNGAMCLFCRRSYRLIKISAKNFDRTKLRTIFEYSSKTFVGQLADLLRFRIDSFVIAGFVGLNFVTYFSVGARFIEYFIQFIISIMGIITPLFSQYEGRGDAAAVTEIFEKATKLSAILSIFVGTSIVVYGKFFIERWMGIGFESSYYVVTILVTAHILALMQHPTVSLLYGISKHQFFVIANMAEGILNLLLSLILVQFYGIYGVALGTVISMSFFKIFIQPVYVCRCLDYPLKKYFFNTILPPTIKTILPLGLFYLMIWNYLLPDYSRIAICGILQVLLFAPVAFFFIFDKSDRLRIHGALAGRF